MVGLSLVLLILLGLTAALGLGYLKISIRKNFLIAGKIAPNDLTRTIKTFPQISVVVNAGGLHHRKRLGSEYFVTTM